MRTIVAGTRSFNDDDLVFKELDGIPFRVTTVVSGGCRGVDLLGEAWAETRALPVAQYLADWSTGKSAGPMRNRQMADNADALVAFWDGKSRGTKNMIDEALTRGLWVRIVRTNG